MNTMNSRRRYGLVALLTGSVIAGSLGLVACTDAEDTPPAVLPETPLEGAEDAGAEPMVEESAVVEVAAPELSALDERLAQRVSFSFAGAAATDVVRYISDTRTVNVVIAPDVAETMANTVVNVKVTDITVGAALRVVARLTGTGITTEGSVVLITAGAAGAVPPEGAAEPTPEFAKKLQKLLSVDFKGAAPVDITDYISRVTGVNVVLVSTRNRPLSDTGLDLTLVEVDARTILATVARIIAARIEVSDDIVFIVPE